MDWAEELKMTIKKTATRKGRSKSREMPKYLDDSSSIATSSPKLNNKEISIDITLDTQQGIMLDSLNANVIGVMDSDAKTGSPVFRRISGGWADTSGSSSKSKKEFFADDRFEFATLKTTTSSPADDDIPTLPDLENFKDEIFDIPQSHVLPASDGPKDKSIELLSQNAFRGTKGNFALLTRTLAHEQIIDEPDEVWEWENIFTDVIADINLDKLIKGDKKIEIRPDEIPTEFHV